MGSYSPRHLKREPKVLNKVGRRGIAAAAAGAVVVPLVSMETASAAPSAGLVQASAVQAAGHVPALGHVAARAYVGPTVRWGSRGTAVQTVQRKLHGLAVDGIFGPRTNAKVRSFQRAHRLVVDGIVGPHTWRALGGYSAGSSSPAPTSSSSIVSIAMSLRGTPYVYGGASRSGFDCSGFTQYVYRQAGKSIPRTASAQAAAAYRVSNPRPGDLMFWGNPAYHAGIYLGNGKMIAARRPGTVVSVQSVWGSPYYGRI
ncbi:MAG TPA: NlpC/P60 family protein [Flexivirga sp.]|uniref:C40 family peptidase n=1 Tax=Flexivirga sp. TaxID=1962927 RepID=UPI002CDB29F9|nr:NlpC/P60 family protein [Flexivirga sp.]HWC22732.1 NlpC/P60 family protein [Flexivirga sp.]